VLKGIEAQGEQAMDVNREEAAHQLFMFTQEAARRQYEFQGAVRVQPSPSPRTRPQLELFYEQCMRVLDDEEIDQLGKMLEKLVGQVT
jgi:hypothetical protein